MKKNRFHGLIDRICEMKNIADPALYYKIAHFEIDGIPFTMMDGAEMEPDSMLYFCDFGPIPDAVRSHAMQRLLEANLVMLGAHSPMFALNYETGNVLLTGRAPLDKITPDALMDALGRYAAQAKNWRETYFLEDQAQGQATAARGQQSTRRTLKKKSGHAQSRPLNH